MAIPITKKASSSCAKNIEAALVAGAGKTAPGFTDVAAGIKGGMEDAMPKKEKVKEPSVEENLENEENGGGAEE